MKLIRKPLAVYWYRAGSLFVVATTAAAPSGINAFIDPFGKGYVELAIDLGISPDRINTIIDFPAVAKYKIKSDGSAQAA